MSAPIAKFTPLRAEMLPDGRLRLQHGLRFQYGQIVISIPEGFEWDGASVPPPLQWAFPRYKHILEASCLHDFLLGEGYDWVTANALFYLAMGAVGIGRVKRLGYFTGVKMGKWGSRAKRGILGLGRTIKSLTGL